MRSAITEMATTGWRVRFGIGSTAFVFAVCQRPSDDDPTELVDDGSTYTIDGTVIGRREYADCIDEWEETAAGTFPFVESDDLLEPGGLIWARVDAEQKVVMLQVITNFLWKGTKRAGCGFGQAGESPSFRTWVCGQFALDGKMVEEAGGPGSVVFDCTESDSSSIQRPKDDRTLTVQGTLTWSAAEP